MPRDLTSTSSAARRADGREPRSPEPKAAALLDAGTGHLKKRPVSADSPRTVLQKPHDGQERCDTRSAAKSGAGYANRTGPPGAI